jgi:hypothetical protein
VVVPDVMAVIFHQPPAEGEGPLVHLLAEARARLAERHAALFRSAGADVEIVVPGRDPHASFGSALARVVRDGPAEARGLVVLGSGAVPLLRRADAVALVSTAASVGRRALTNNRYSSDVCAVSEAGVLAAAASLPADNALPRWLDEQAGYEVRELTGRRRLALDMDSPLDLALLALRPDAPASLRRLATAAAIRVPRLTELRAVAADPRAELLVAGRAGADTLRWLERSTRCRVRFLAEERGLRAGFARRPQRRPPRSVLGRLLAMRGPAALGEIVAELADGAIVDTRVLLADRLGADEGAWPTAEDRFASDLLHAEAVGDPWLGELTRAAAAAPAPILLGAHTLVGPAVPHLLGGTGSASRERGRHVSLG